MLVEEAARATSRAATPTTQQRQQRSNSRIAMPLATVVRLEHQEILQLSFEFSVKPFAFADLTLSFYDFKYRRKTQLMKIVTNILINENY